MARWLLQLKPPVITPTLLSSTHGLQQQPVDEVFMSQLEGSIMVCHGATNRACI
jgi:hypothetical protein